MLQLLVLYAMFTSPFIAILFFLGCPVQYLVLLSLLVVLGGRDE